jgi:hypothetical protein
MLFIGLGFGLPATGAPADQGTHGGKCGLQIRATDVLVLDLQHVHGDPEMAHEFVLEHAGEYRLAFVQPEEIRTRGRPSRDPGILLSQAKRLGAREGCDLVVVLKTGPYLGRQRGTRARIRERGYAFVVMGQRVESRG